MGDRMAEVGDKVRGSQAWTAIFRPGSIFRKGYTDSPRNRSYVIMNSLLYHLHPVKVKRHAVKVSYTLCLGGLSFFLFILLTITGIFLMFFYKPTEAQAWDTIKQLHTGVAFGLLVRNMHRWAAHLMVLTVFLHMARVFYHGAYKPPREFNWIIGVQLLMFTLLLSFTGYLLPWDQLSLWAVTVGTNMMGYTPVLGTQLRFGLVRGDADGRRALRNRRRRSHAAAAHGGQGRFHPGRVGQDGRQGADLAGPVAGRVRGRPGVHGVHARLLDLRQRPDPGPGQPLPHA